MSGLLKKTTLVKLKDVRKTFLWAAVGIIIGELVLGVVVILTQDWNEIIGKLMGTMFLIALALFISINNFIRIEKGDKAVQGFALVSFFANILWLLLATLMIWGLIDYMWYETTRTQGAFSYALTTGHITVAAKIMIIAMSLAAMGFWSSNVLAIKETVKPVKPLKITAVVCEIYCCAYSILVSIISDTNEMPDSMLRLTALTGLAGLAFIVTTLAAYIISRANKEESPATTVATNVSAPHVSTEHHTKTDDELRAEIEEKVRREIIEKEVRAKMESEKHEVKNKSTENTSSEE